MCSCAGSVRLWGAARVVFRWVRQGRAEAPGKLAKKGQNGAAPLHVSLARRIRSRARANSPRSSSDQGNSNHQPGSAIGNREAEDGVNETFHRFSPCQSWTCEDRLRTCSITERLIYTRVKSARSVAKIAIMVCVSNYLSQARTISPLWAPVWTGPLRRINALS